MDDPVTCNGTITGGTFTGTITGDGDGTLAGGDFTGANLGGFQGTVGAGAKIDGYSFENGKLTVTSISMESDKIPPAIWDGVKSIEVAAGAYFYLISDFSGNIHIADGGALGIEGTISGGTITAEGLFRLNPTGEITGSTNVQISGDTYLSNDGAITGGTFTGVVRNHTSITGGDFTGATVTNDGGSITGGKFSNIALDRESGELTITGNVDLSNGGSLAPLTIGLDDGSIQSITIASTGTFNAGATP